MIDTPLCSMELRLACARQATVDRDGAIQAGTQGPEGQIAAKR
jgi:hypothetical protein